MGVPDDAAARFASLRAGFDGAVLLPGTGYDEARVLFNAMIDRRPAVIAQCASDDVVRASVAPAGGLDVAVRGGRAWPAGPGRGPGGGPAPDVRGHRRPRRARPGSGWRHDEPSRPGRPAPTWQPLAGGLHHGVGGFTLGGGTGWLDRTFGLACDNLLSVELVTALGEVVVASDTENADLFGAARRGRQLRRRDRADLPPARVPTMTLTLLMWPPPRPSKLSAPRDLFEGDRTRSAGASCG